MKEFAKAFYYSVAWKRTRAAYAKSKGGLCELCLERGLYNPGEIVHHKVVLNESNINDPSVTLNFQNLQLLCRECHAKVHGNRQAQRFSFDENGCLLVLPDRPPS